ncbi:MAG: LysR family transcriptional regulator [Rhodospirillaceae bacterium]
MDITLIRTFLVICEVGNFVKASERLYVTQSTVSTRIRLLEETLGQSVFIRTKAGASLTPAGRQFKPFAEKMVQVWEQARHNVGLPEAFNQVLTIGVEFTIWEYLMAAWMSWAKTGLPSVALRADIAAGEDLMHRLAEGLIDIAVTTAPRHRSGLRIEKLMEDALILVSADANTRGPWEEGYVFVEWGDAFRAWHSEAFPHLEAPVLAVNYGPLAQQHILLNGGAAFLPRRSVGPRLESGQLHIVSGAPEFSRQIYLVQLETVDGTQLRRDAVAGLRIVTSH